MSTVVIPARSVTVRVEDTTLDLICFEVASLALGDRVRAGQLSGYTEAALVANPGLAVTAILPLGKRIELPEFVVQAPTTQHVRLWD